MDKTLYERLALVKSLLEVQNLQQNDIRIKDSIQELDMIIKLYDQNSVNGNPFIEGIVIDALHDAQALIKSG